MPAAPASVPCGLAHAADGFARRPSGNRRGDTDRKGADVVADDRRDQEEGWQQVAGDRRPESVGAEDQGSPPDGLTRGDAGEADRERRSDDVPSGSGGLSPSGEDEDTPERPA